MKKPSLSRRSTSFGVVMTMTAMLLVMLTAPSATAATPVFASLKAFTGTLSVSGAGSVDAAVAEYDSAFVQMAPDATVTMAFPSGTYAIPDGTSAPDLTVYVFDALFRADAGVSVYVKSNTNNWVSLGVHADTANIGLNLEGIGMVNEVRIIQDGYYIDPAYPTLGFDLNAVSAEHTATLTEAGSCVAPTSTTGWVYSGWTRFVSAESPTAVVTTTSLVDGIGYRFQATGLYSAGPAGGPGTEILADARYSQRVVGQATPTESVYGYESFGPTLLDLLIDGTAADWQGDVFNSSHTYTSDHVGAGSPATFDLKVYDLPSAYANNIGGLCVSVFEKDSDEDGVPDSTDNCPSTPNPNQEPVNAVTFLPPFDGSTPSHLVANTMKAGRVVPVKVTIYDTCTGTYLTDPSSIVTIALKEAAAIPDVNEAVEAYADPGASNGNTLSFRFADGFWIYNLDSRTVLDGSALVVGTEYRIDVYVAGSKVTTDQWALLKPKK